MSCVVSDLSPRAIYPAPKRGDELEAAAKSRAPSLTAEIDDFHNKIGTKRHLAATQHSVAFGSTADIMPSQPIYDGMQAMTPSNTTLDHQRIRSIN